MPLQLVATKDFLSLKTSINTLSINFHTRVFPEEYFMKSSLHFDSLHRISLLIKVKGIIASVGSYF